MSQSSKLDVASWHVVFVTDYYEYISMSTI